MATKEWPPCPDATCDGTMRPYGNDEAICTHCQCFDFEYDMVIPVETAEDFYARKFKNK